MPSTLITQRAAAPATVPARFVLSAVVACLTALVLTGCGSQDHGTAEAARPSPSGGGTVGSPSPGPSASSPAAGPSPSVAATVAVPAGVTAGIVIFDRRQGTFVVAQKASWRFRSASLVKLLIALDYFWDRGPSYTAPAADRPKLDIMLRSSDDTAATGLWKARGQRDIVTRMVQRLGLQDTAPPPASQPGYWGYTAVSAGDLVRVYRYILDEAPAPVRDVIMGDLHQSTKCGTDRYDQSFGIPSSFRKPWSAKQGWSGFGDDPATPCVTDASLPRGGGPGRFVDAAAPNQPDMSGEVLHTTGTVGDGDRYVVAVLSVHPNGTQFAKAAAALTKLTGSLPLPAAVKVA
ncbi:hypothetical protein Daura_40375 [Dactylosporangium aurantiacum]|uniref:Uncharacterized protein n=1 Tax=Dactylosporangium aurantiacum TaxID=35754 RepID=A0A9Q9IBP2_9ACTN|nr:hypothetical protein [Dactylosporangium aurantiacum]MDG6102962.1 hypothetical protein [Dactylosporangium aurantiacum]UWZ52816.1 hypothetical protein Daura_40375 [Dactylosporangium aurantiacum]